jgi:hypothetical protein
MIGQIVLIHQGTDWISAIQNVWFVRQKQMYLDMNQVCYQNHALLGAKYL